MGGGNDRIARPPDDLQRNGCRLEIGHERARLPAVLEHGVGEAAQRFAHAVQPLVLQQIVDHLPADQVLVGEQLLEHRLEIAARFRGDEAVDIARH